MEASDEKMVASAADYGEVYDYLDAYRQEIEREQSRAREEIVLYEEEIASDSAAGGAAMDMGAASGNSVAKLAGSEEMGSQEAAYAEDYSETNVRQDGVDEGDVVKTDGTYLYVLKDSRVEVSIVDTREGVMKEIETISVKEEEWIEEIYLERGWCLCAADTTIRAQA